MLLQKTDAGKWSPFWATAKENKLNQINLDDTALQNYSAALQANTDQTVAMQTAMLKASQSAKDFAAAGNLTTDSIEAFKASQIAAIKQTGFFKSAISALKGVMSSLAGMFINMAVMFAITEGIKFVSDQIDKWILTAKEARQAAEDLASAWKETDDTLASHKKTLDSIASEYATLSKGVDSFGKNVSLTSDEFDRYNELANQLGAMFPKLVTGWTDQEVAILSTRGSVDDLTSAYQDLIDKQNEAKANKLEENIENFASSDMARSFWAWDENGSQTKLDYAKSQLDLIRNSWDKRGIIKELLSAAKSGNSSILAAFNSQLTKDVVSASGMDSAKTYEENLYALESYVRALESETSVAVENVKASIEGVLSLDDSYKDFDSSVKSLVSMVVEGIDSDFIAAFANVDNPGEALRIWIQRSIIDPFSSYDFSNIIDIKSLFDSSEISVGTYQKYYADFLKSIEGFAPQVQTALSESFSPDIDNLIAKVQGELLDEYDGQVYTLSLGDLKIAADLDIAGASWDELQEKIDSTSALTAQSITDLTTDLTALVDVYELITTAIGEQNTNGYVTVDTYQKLIAANQDYASSFSSVNGQLQLNADSAYKLADAMSEVPLEEAEAGKQASRSAIDDNVEQIKEYNKQLELLQGKEDSDDYYKALEDQRDALIDTNEELEDQYQQYDAITTQIKAMTGAYAKYLAAQKTSNAGDVYESMTGVADTLKEAIKLGKIVNDDTQTAVDYVLGGSSEGLSYEEQMKRAKEAQKKYARYFTEDNKGVANFGSDLIKKGLATKDANGYTTLGEGVTGKDIMDELGLSQDAVVSILKDLEEYGGQFDWSKLFPEMTQEQIDQAEKPASEIDQKGQDLLDQANAYYDKAEQGSKLIEDGDKLYDNALSGDYTPKVEVTPPTGEAGSVSLFTSGTSNESTTPMPWKDPNDPKNRIEQTVFVNVETGEPISASALLLNVTENADGSLSYNVTGNASAGETIGGDTLILNVNKNSDGTYSYDVFVNGTPGKIVDNNSIILGTNPEDGSYKVTVNGTVGQTVMKEGIVLGLDENREWNVVTNGKVGSTVTVQSLVTGTDFEDEYSVNVNGKPGDQVDSEDLVTGTDSNDEYTVKVNTEAGETVSPSDLLSGVKENDDGTLSYDVNVNVAPTSTTTPQTTDNGLPPAPAGSTVPQAKVTVGADTKPAQSQIDEFSNTLSEDDQVILSVFLETYDTNGKTWDEFVTDFLAFKNQTLVIPADIDTNTLYEKVESFEGSLTTFIVPVGADTDPGYQKAVELKDMIEKMSPKMKVRIQTNVPGYASGTREITEKQVAVVDDGSGAETILHPDGTAEIGTNEGPRTVVLNPGDKVLTAEETKKMLSRSGDTALVGRFADGSAGSWPTIPSSASKSLKSKSVSWEKSFAKLFDWIEILKDRFSKVIDDMGRKVKDAIGYAAKNSAIDSTTKLLDQQIKTLKTASSQYMDMANAVAKKSGLSSGIVQKVQNGTVDISSYSESTQKKIEEYQKWYNKVLDTQDAIVDLEDQQQELANQKLGNIIDQYDNLNSAIETSSDTAQASIDLLVAQGKELSADDYTTLIENQTKKVAQLREEQAALTAEFNAQLASGSIVEGSDAWYEYKDQIGQLDSEILNAETDLIDLNDTADNLTVTKLGYQMSAITEEAAALERQISLIEGQGGKASESMYQGLISNGYQQIDNLNAQNAALNEQLKGLDPLSEKYQEIQGQINSNKDAISEAMVNQEQWNDAIIDLKIDKLQEEKDALSETNDEYQRQKDLQQAIEDLEKAKSQRTKRMLVDGKFQYVADQKSIDEAQKKVDDLELQQKMADIDKQMEDLKDSKATDNVYDTAGTATSASSTANAAADSSAATKLSDAAAKAITDAPSNLTPASIADLLSKIGTDKSLYSITSSANIGSNMNDLLAQASKIPISQFAASPSMGDTIINMQERAIYIEAKSANANEVFEVLVAKLPNALEQAKYKK